MEVAESVSQNERIAPNIERRKSCSGKMGKLCGEMGLFVNGVPPSPPSPPPSRTFTNPPCASSIP